MGMRKELLTVTLLLILGLPHGFQQGTGNANQTQRTEEQECPTWFVPRSNQTGGCKCGVQTFSSVAVVKCDDYSKQTMLMSGFCMTYNESTDVTVAGRCPYNSHKTDYQELYVKLPLNVSHLNEFMCGVLNRTGLLCTHCQEGLGIPVFSYTLHCLPCLGSFGGWLLYIFLAVFPTTIFFLIVIIFQIQVTSAPMNAFIFICQVFTNMVNVQPYSFLNRSPYTHVLMIILSTLYGFCNLDFFRYVIPSFCVSDKLTPIQVAALEYVVALYPLLLIITTYICVELHARDCRIIVWLWRLVNRCLAFVLRGREITFSFVHGFASFLLLSYSKILFVSVRLLVNIHLFDSTGQIGSKSMVYYDASVRYFSVPHFPFVLLAIFMLCVFVVIPALVLLLYPTRAFQKSLGCCRVRWHALHAFVDTFQGYYKNGTEGTRDYRYFAGLYVIVRILPFFVIAGYYLLHFLILVIIFLTIVSLLFAILRPYKEDWINIWDSVVFALLAFYYFWMMCVEYVLSLPIDFVTVTPIVPLIYIIFYAIGKHTKAFRNCRMFMNNYRANPQLESDWLLNHDSEEYRQHLPRDHWPENEHSNSATIDETYPPCGNSLHGYGSVP